MRHARAIRTAAALALAFGLGAAHERSAAQAAPNAPNARAIMEKVSLTRKLDGSEAVLRMSIVNEKGQAQERKITMATKLYDGGKTEKEQLAERRELHLGTSIRTTDALIRDSRDARLSLRGW